MNYLIIILGMISIVLLIRNYYLQKYVDELEVQVRRLKDECIDMLVDILNRK